jgi:hypothetical protein
MHEQLRGMLGLPDLLVVCANYVHCVPASHLQGRIDVCTYKYQSRRELS